MLTPSELKVVLSTLSTRKSWLVKKLEEGPNTEFESTLGLIESAIQKLAPKSASTPPKPSVKTASIEPLASRGRTLETARVLVADDDKESSTLLISTLAAMGMKFLDLGEDGVQAFDKIKRAETPYDIILCDWDMPLLSGIEVHQKATASNTLKGAYFCMVTSVSDGQKIRSAIQQGVSDYIVKPIDAAVLESKLRNALGMPAE